MQNGAPGCPDAPLFILSGQAVRTDRLDGVGFAVLDRVGGSFAILQHLLGLCLSRAAALRALAGALPQDDPRIPVLTAAATANLAAGLPATTSGDFTTDHWLATFAALALGGGVRA